MQMTKSPFVGVLSFIVVLLVMPLGHALMILIEKILGHQYQYPGAILVGLLGAVLVFIGTKKNSETAAT